MSLLFIYSMLQTTIEKIAELTHEHSCRVRLKLKADDAPEPWAKGIGLPVNGYIELNGPCLFKEVEWLEIDPTVAIWIGRLVNPRQHNYTDSLISMLEQERVAYTMVEGIIRIPFDAVAP